MKRIFLVGLYLLFGSSLLTGEIIDLMPEKTEITILSSQKNALELNVSLDSFTRTGLRKQNINFDNIFIDEWGRLTEEGLPALPSISKMIIVPENGEVTIDVLVNHSIEIPNIIPFPAQPSAVDNDAFDTPPFTINEDYYSFGDVYPKTIYSVSDKFMMRGVPFVYVTIHPFQYKPDTNILTIYDDFNLSISISGEMDYDERLYSSYITPSVLSLALNPEMITPQYHSFKNDDGADLIIVTTYDFMDAAETLKEWKSQKGFYTDIVYLEDIGSTAQYIYTYLFIAYETWVLPPSFVLFLGDVEIVPTNYEPDQVSGGYMGTDRTYACMDADFHPDIGYGRISVDNQTQAFTVINKIIQYEKDPPDQASFYNEMVNAGYFQDDEHDGYESRRFIKTSEEIRDFLLTENYDSERIYVTEDSVNPTNYNNGYYANGEPIPNELLRVNGFPWDGNATDISNTINEGIFLLVHRDHGYTAGWGDPAYNIGNVQQLANGELLPMVFSINCQTGWFDSETDSDPATFESFCEEFLRKENGGAVSTIGACRNSMSGYNDYLTLGMIDSMWENFINGWGYNTNGYMSPVLLQGLMSMEQFWGGNLTQYQYNLFHVIGDPTLQVWRSQPAEIIATHDISFPYDVTSIPITASIDEGIASLVVDGELVGKMEFSTSSFDLYLSENLTSPQNGVITITARDHTPYMQTVTFIPPDGSYVIIEFFSVSDENGNNDGEWDAGEEISLTYMLRNAGNQTADSVTFTIDSALSQLQIYDPILQINGLLPDQSIQFSTDALISMTCPHNDYISIEAIIENPEGEFIYIESITVTNLPKLALETDSIYYEVSETGIVEIPFTIENIGADTLVCELINNSHQCANLYSANTFMTIPHVLEFDILTEFTVMAWLNVQNVSQPGFVLTKGFINGDLSFVVSIPNMNSILYKFRNVNGSDFQKIISYPLTYGEWFNLAIVVDGSSIISYINGEEVGNDPFISPIHSTSDDILVGSYANSTYEFNGYIDELALYTVALPVEEIQEKMITTIRGIDAGLLSYYQLDQATQFADYCGYNDMTPSGDILFDLSGAPITTWVGFDTYSLSILPYQSESIQVIFNTEGYTTQLFSSSFDLISNASNVDDLSIPIELLFEPYSIDDPINSNEYILTFRNPFGPGCKISFAIQQQKRLRIDIYNLKGQFVQTLVDDSLAPQHFEIQWSGKDFSGKLVENGVYFLKVETDDSKEIRKMVFLR
ncbi:MAG TPA: T9SS type A sorting domain-containing protein [Candidatus Cloacimonetes bacterium]|nr:T9SS type A sorting domain-containing protein [Candidatus Cloacimonadota bacterium]HEX37937.1 T9SS type A sorting domain-containing protein [Candidatus Cloacimonadota bacterium]